MRQEAWMNPQTQADIAVPAAEIDEIAGFPALFEGFDGWLKEWVDLALKRAGLVLATLGAGVWVLKLIP